METIAFNAHTVNDSLAKVWEASRKKFDDAIYRTRTGDTKTAEQLWSELAEAQEAPIDGLVSGLTCTGILNQLARRGQIAKNW